MKRSLLIIALLVSVVFAVSCSQGENAVVENGTEAEANAKAETAEQAQGDVYYEVILTKFAERLATKEQWEDFFAAADINTIHEKEMSLYLPQDGDVLMLPADAKTFSRFSSAAKADMVYVNVVVISSVDDKHKEMIEEGSEVYMLKDPLAKGNIYEVIPKP